MTSPEVGFPALLQDFFLRRLVKERGASAHTIASYRDSPPVSGQLPSPFTSPSISPVVVVGCWVGGRVGGEGGPLGVHRISTMFPQDIHGQSGQARNHP